MSIHPEGMLRSRFECLFSMTLLYGYITGSLAMYYSTSGQGLTLVHFPAQPEPLLVTEATSGVHFSAQLEACLSLKSPNIALRKCSRLAEKWTHVARKKRLP